MKKANNDSVRIHTDGGSRGNPGPAAYGYVVFAPEGEIVAEEGRYIGIATNNQAEYQGIVAALDEIVRRKIASPIICFLDSELVVRQINGVYRMKNPTLKPHLDHIRELLKQIPQGVTFQHVPRIENAHADHLVNQALDGNEHKK